MKGENQVLFGVNSGISLVPSCHQSVGNGEAAISTHKLQPVMQLFSGNQIRILIIGFLKID